MNRYSNWLKSYGIWAKIYVGLIFFILLNGQSLFLSIREVSSYRSHLPTAKYDSYIQEGGFDGQYPPYSPEGQDWRKRKESAANEIKQILAEIEAKGDNYTKVDYFRNMERVMELEDKYKLRLMGGTMMPFEAVYRASADTLGKEQPITNEQAAYIQKIQDKHSLRNGESPSRAPTTPINWLAAAVWLARKYFWLMLFWLAIYLIRFLERDKSIRIFQRHHHELGRFIEDSEPYPGNLSLKAELLLCPERFLLRVLLWPVYCVAYPHHECVAEAVRFQRLKAHFLKYKPFGYQLSDREEAILLAQAKRRVKNFDKTIRDLFNFDSTTLVKKSLLAAYCSLVFGVLFQPAIVLAASYSKKVDAHFYGNSQIVLVEHQKDAGDQVRADSPSQPDQPTADWLDLPVCFELIVPPSLSERLKELPSIKPLQVLADILHIPLSGLLAARCF